MSWLDLYFLVRQMTTDWRLGGRTCFAALVSAFLYHERFHSSNAVADCVKTRLIYAYRTALAAFESLRSSLHINKFEAAYPTASIIFFTPNILITLFML